MTLQLLINNAFIQITFISILLLLILQILIFILNYPSDFLAKFFGKIKTAFLIIKNKPFLIFIVASNIIVILLTAIMQIKRGAMLWSIPLSFAFATIMTSILYYKEDFFEWCNKRKKIEKIIDSIISLSTYCTPVLSFYITIEMANIYFNGLHTKYELILIIVVAIYQFLYILVYCYELIHINTSSLTTKNRIFAFILSMIHIIQLFTNIYILLQAVDQNAFANIIATTPFQLSFDFTYFSAMTFFNGNDSLIPVSRIAKTIVLIETFILPVYISIIIFGMLPSSKDNN